MANAVVISSGVMVAAATVALIEAAVERKAGVATEVATEAATEAVIMQQE